MKIATGCDHRRLGWRSTTTNSYDFDLSVGQTVSGNNFGQSNTARVAGTVFRDDNANGKQDAGELGKPGWNVFLDANANGKLDAGEAHMYTDSSGRFGFGAVAAGTYVVHVAPIVGTVFTKPAGGTFSVSLGTGQVLTSLLFGEKPV